MSAEFIPFVSWGLTMPQGKRAHINRNDDSENALCGVNAPFVIETHLGFRRCPACVRAYLATMTATDELVWAFGEDGRIKR